MCDVAVACSGTCTATAASAGGAAARSCLRRTRSLRSAAAARCCTGRNERTAAAFENAELLAPGPSSPDSARAGRSPSRNWQPGGGAPARTGQGATPGPRGPSPAPSARAPERGHAPPFRAAQHPRHPQHPQHPEPGVGSAEPPNYSAAAPQCHPQVLSPERLHGPRPCWPPRLCPPAKGDIDRVSLDGIDSIASNCSAARAICRNACPCITHAPPSASQRPHCMH